MLLNTRENSPDKKYNVYSCSFTVFTQKPNYLSQLNNQTQLFIVSQFHSLHQIFNILFALKYEHKSQNRFKFRYMINSRSL